MNFKKLFVLTFCILCSSNLFSQSFQWRLLQDSPGKTGQGRFEDIYFINSGTGWVVGYSGEVYRTTNGGSNWNRIFSSSFGDEFRSVGFFDSNFGLLGTLITDSNRILYRTTNGGVNWTAVTNISGGQRPQGICGMSIVNENVAYACGRYFGSGRIIKTTDKGVSWNLVFSDTSMTRTLVDCYFWDENSGIAIGGSLPILNGNGVVIKTTNGGLNWQRVHKTIQTEEWCWKISFISKQTGYVSVERFSGMANYLKTTNAGSNWIELPFRDYDVEGIGFVNENTGWIGGWSGPTYTTTNGGTNWNLSGWGTNVNRIRFLSDTIGYAVGDRVYKYSSGLVGVNPVSIDFPSSFELKQNYPNPFNPKTNISFTIPTLYMQGNVQNTTLKIYDALGKELMRLVDEVLSPGNYEVEFDGDNFPSGIYYYRLVSGKFEQVNKMTLLK